MKRRRFSLALSALPAYALAAPAGLGALAATNARAQGIGPVEGLDYVDIGKQLPVAPGRIDVIEFFWYGCPHCYAFEPKIRTWVASLPPSVAFRRIPIAFRPEPFIAHQKIYYALEALGLVELMHDKVFGAIHVDHLRMDKPEEIAAFVGRHGGNEKAFLDTFNAFAVTAKARQATQMQSEFGVDAVPAIGIQGRYLTSGPLAGSPERSLVVANFLLDKVRPRH